MVEIDEFILLLGCAKSGILFYVWTLKGNILFVYEFFLNNQYFPGSLHFAMFFKRHCPLNIRVFRARGSSVKDVVFVIEICVSIYLLKFAALV